MKTNPLSPAEICRVVENLKRPAALAARDSDRDLILATAAACERQLAELGDRRAVTPRADLEAPEVSAHATSRTKTQTVSTPATRQESVRNWGYSDKCP